MYRFSERNRLVLYHAIVLLWWLNYGSRDWVISGYIFGSTDIMTSRIMDWHRLIVVALSIESITLWASGRAHEGSKMLLPLSTTWFKTKWCDSHAQVHSWVDSTSWIVMLIIHMMLLTWEGPLRVIIARCFWSSLDWRRRYPERL